MEKIDIYDGRYVVYIDGSVYSNLSNKMLKEQIDKAGYHYYRLTPFAGGKPTHWFKHRIIASYFLPKVVGKNHINHKDGNKNNNLLENLEWCTAYENNKHARDNKLNNVSLSNSERWKDDIFRNRTSLKISDTRKKLGLSKGRYNGRSKVDLLYKGQTWTMTELSEEIDVKVSTLNTMKSRLKKGLNPTLAKKHNIKYIG